jgi:hypothetical protein
MKRGFNRLALRFALVSALVLVGGPLGGNSYADTASSIASATVVEPVSVNESTPGLSVSTFVSDSTGSLLVRIPGDGLCAASGAGDEDTAHSLTVIGDESAGRTNTRDDFIALFAGNGTLIGTAPIPSGGSPSALCAGGGGDIKNLPTLSTVLVVGAASVTGPYAGTFPVTIAFN